jgi:hypothetical protein
MISAVVKNNELGKLDLRYLFNFYIEDVRATPPRGQRRSATAAFKYEN